MTEKTTQRRHSSGDLGQRGGKLAIVWVYPEVEGRVTFLSSGRTVLGRDFACDVRLPGDQNGQGRDRAGDAAVERAEGTVHRGQLRRPAGGSRRRRALRVPEGRLHERGPREPRLLSGRPRRDALPRRGGRAFVRDPTEA